MNDRELLEMAAKAAGIPIDKSTTNGGGRAGRGFDMLGNVVTDWHNGTKWNPLTDDGDALRLAVKLRLEICISVCRVGGEDGWYNAEADEIGIEAATRRAIVRAAAELGRNIKERGDGGGV